MAHVLLIDDDDDIRTFTRMTLELDGHQVTEAVRGLVGLELLDAAIDAGQRPIVILDVQMPDVDGWHILERLRASPRTVDIPVILCTVQADELSRERGFGLGADAYQVKPFDLEELTARVELLDGLTTEQLADRRSEASGFIARANNEFD